MFGRQAYLPLDVLFDSSLTDSKSPNKHAVSLKKQLTSAYETVWHIRNQAWLVQDFYDIEIHGDPYLAGDWVWVLNSKVPKIFLKTFIYECVHRINF